MRAADGRAADHQRRAAREQRAGAGRRRPATRQSAADAAVRIRGHVFSCSPSSCSVDPVAHAVQHQQVDFLDARGALVRHADVDVGFAQHARASCRRRVPVSATTVISRSCAASIAASTLAELPLVDSASSTSPAWPSARTCLEKMRLVVVVVGDRGEDRGVGGERDRRQLGPLALEAADELGGEMLGIGSRAAVAAGQHLAAAGDAADHRLHRVGDRLAEHFGRLVLQVGAVDEVLLDALFEHGHG